MTSLKKFDKYLQTMGHSADCEFNKRANPDDCICGFEAALQVMSDFSEARSKLETVQAKNAELLKFVAGLKEEFCGWTCPSVWKTADGQPHDQRCVDLRTLLESVDKQDLCGCGVPGCNKRYDHRR